MTSHGEWRIDDLARRADVTVDTIRYYAREGLLPPPERSGRHTLYGPRHLDRLERVRELRDKRFSLAAIRALLESERPGLESVFVESEHTYDLERLVECSRLERTFVERLREVGILSDPEEFGREEYDTADLQLLEAVAELRAIGMPDGLLVQLAAIYVRHFERLQRDVVDLFAGRTVPPPDLDAGALEQLQRRLTASAGRLIPAADRVLDYVHRRTLERTTLDAIREQAGAAGAHAREAGHDRPPGP